MLRELWAHWVREVLSALSLSDHQELGAVG
jgi:hypothetical protein